MASFIKTDEHQELLKTVDIQLLVWNQQLFNLQTGDCESLVNADADSIAEVAQLLIQKIGKKNIKNKHIALYLANIEFVSTEYELPEVAAPAVSAALKYKVAELMPAYPGQLMLAVNHDDSRKKNLALWLDHQRTESLFNAFHQQNMELTAIIPRIALAPLLIHDKMKKHQCYQFREQDDQHLLQVTLMNNHLVQWRHISLRDKQEETYFQEWQAGLESCEEMTLIDTVDFWSAVDKKQIEQLSYAFFPESAQHNLKKHSRLKKGRLAIIAGIILSLLLAAPFVKNSVRYAKWDKRYQEYKEKTVDVRKMRSSVTQFEDNWGLFIDYPQVDVTNVIQILDKVIPKDSWLKGFKIKEGFVEIEGFSPTPTRILEIIAKQTLFEQVAFNRSRTKQRGKDEERFGLTFHLHKINVSAYQDKYFPVN
jgi:hypothetical protein